MSGVYCCFCDVEVNVMVLVVIVIVCEWDWDWFGIEGEWVIVCDGIKFWVLIW